MSYRGNVEDRSISSGVAEARLYGFPVNSSLLGWNHTAWLDDHVVPIVAGGGHVSVIGEASRTGSAEHNARLSRRRARRVVEYIGQHSDGRVRCTESTSRRGVTSQGIGERGADAIGQPDGTEDSLFRAVTVRASWQPRPSQPQPQRRASTVRRVISRTWRETVSSSPSASSGGDGEHGAALAQILRRLYASHADGGTDSRQYARVPREWTVNRVTEHFSMDEQLRGPHVNQIRTTREILYEWGVRTQTVEVFRRTTRVGTDGEIDETTRTDRYPRSRVWRHVTAPNATTL